MPNLPVLRDRKRPRATAVVGARLAGQGKQVRCRSAAVVDAETVGQSGSVAALFARAFGKLNLERRARLLGRLLGSVGPLGLVVIGGGYFAKYLRNARSQQVPISPEDAARATSSQVYEVVRYVEQSNPCLVDALLAMLLQERTVTPHSA